MATSQTTNYQLNQWEPTDHVQRTDFNADNAKIDAALADLETGKADGAAFNTLAATVAGHTTQLALKGNCAVEYFTYTGTGAYGTTSPTRITFSKPPLLFIILGSAGASAFGSKLMDRYMVNSSTVTSGKAAWNGNQVSLTNTVHDYLQLNAAGATYHVFGFSIPE